MDKESFEFAETMTVLSALNLGKIFVRHNKKAKTMHLYAKFLGTKVLVHVLDLSTLENAKEVVNA